MAIVTLTELESVNLILASADMMPVTTLDSTTTAEATLAKAQLDAAYTEILNEGWDFNTEYEYELAADDTGVIYIDTVNARVGPSYTVEGETPHSPLMRYDVVENPSVIVRGDRLYDRYLGKSDQFDRSVKGTAIFKLAWASVPFEAQNYMTKKAARRFHEYHVGTSDALRSLVQDEQEARRLLLDMDMDAGSYSVFDAPDMHAGLGAGNYLVGRAAHAGQNPFTTRDR